MYWYCQNVLWLNNSSCLESISHVHSGRQFCEFQEWSSCMCNFSNLGQTLNDSLDSLRWPTLPLCVCLTQSCFLFCQFSFMYMCSHLISITMISSCTYMFTCRAHILSYRPKWCCIIFKSKIFSNCFLKILKMQRGCQIVLSSYYLFPSRLQSVPHSLVCLKFIFMHLAHLEVFP